MSRTLHDSRWIGVCPLMAVSDHLGGVTRKVAVTGDAGSGTAMMSFYTRLTNAVPRKTLKG